MKSEISKNLISQDVQKAPFVEPPIPKPKEFKEDDVPECDLHEGVECDKYCTICKKGVCYKCPPNAHKNKSKKIQHELISVKELMNNARL